MRHKQTPEEKLEQFCDHFTGIRSTENKHVFWIPDGMDVLYQERRMGWYYFATAFAWSKRRPVIRATGPYHAEAEAVEAYDEWFEAEQQKDEPCL